MRPRSTRTAAALLAGATALTLGLSACGGSSTSGALQPGAKIPLVASTNVWGSVLRAVGGDEVQVKALIDQPGADPHDYEAKPADGQAISAAKLVLYNGGGYDDF